MDFRKHSSKRVFWLVSLRNYFMTRTTPFALAFSEHQQEVLQFVSYMYQWSTLRTLQVLHWYFWTVPMKQIPQFYLDRWYEIFPIAANYNGFFSFYICILLLPPSLIVSFFICQLFHFPLDQISFSKLILYLLVPFVVVVNYLVNRNVISVNLPAQSSGKVWGRYFSNPTGLKQMIQARKLCLWSM